MDARKGKLLKNSFGVSLATLASRITGLIRTRLEAMALGGGTICTIWAFSLMIPNLLRRLLGEGAVGTALTPLVAETELQEGIPAARRKLAQLLCLLGALLALIVILVSLGTLALGKFAPLCGSGFWRSDRIVGVMGLLPVIMPYAFFICLTGVIGAVLNYAGIFARPALTALLFNFCMLAGLLAGILLKIPPDSLLMLLAVLTPVSGAVQLLLMLWMLRICGRFPIFDREIFRDLSFTGRVLKIAAPALAGYGALQLSFLADRSMAICLGDRAVPALTYVDRIVDLPIGLFAVSLGAVLMASMTRSAAAGDWQSMREELNFSIRHVWFICAPMAAGVVFFHTPILRVLCLGGRYTLTDLNAAKMVAVFYGMGIPFFCSLKVILPAFFSRKDTRRPFFVSLVAIAANLSLNLILMFPLRQAGLALATVIASVINNTILLVLLRRDGFPLLRETALSCFRSAFLAAGAGAAALCLMPPIRAALRETYLNDCLLLLITAAFFAAIYWVFAYVCSAGELREFVELVRRRRR